MKTTSLRSPHFIAGLVLAVTLGLILVMHVSSAPRECCGRETGCVREKEAVDISLLKLI